MQGGLLIVSYESSTPGHLTGCFLGLDCFNRDLLSLLVVSYQKKTCSTAVYTVTVMKCLMKWNV